MDKKRKEENKLKMRKKGENAVGRLREKLYLKVRNKTKLPAFCAVPKPVMFRKSSFTKVDST
jgi:hypothetical protein